MSARLAKTLVVTALCGSLGLHWALLQTVAWVGMAVDFAQDAPVSVALAKTFDGKHPCKLCDFVNNGKQAEKKQDVLKADAKLDCLLAASAPRLFPPALPSRAPHPQLHAPGRTELPPTPPPRAA